MATSALNLAFNLRPQRQLDGDEEYEFVPRNMIMGLIVLAGMCVLCLFIALIGFVLHICEKIIARLAPRAKKQPDVNVPLAIAIDMNHCVKNDPLLVPHEDGPCPTHQTAHETVQGAALKDKEADDLIEKRQSY